MSGGTWRNWAGNERAVTEVVQPGSADEVAAVLDRRRGAGRRVRPIGSRALVHRHRPARGRAAGAATGLAELGEVGDDGLAPSARA